MTRTHPFVLRLPATLALLFATGLGVGIACKSDVVNDEQCFYFEGNATCAERHGDALPYCGTFCVGKDGNPSSPNVDGCVDWLPPEGCYSPCGGEQDVAEDASCLDVAGTESESGSSSVSATASGTMTGEPTTDAESGSGTDTGSSSSSDSGPVGCKDSSECTEVGAPVCVNAECSACGQASDSDAACASKDAGSPVCDEESGACVECTPSNSAVCVDGTPVCDVAGLECRACAEHAECGDACEYGSGECFDEEGGDCWVELVGGGSIQGAIDGVADGGRCTIVLQENGATDFNESFTVDSGKRIALVALTNEVVVLGVSGATLGVSGGAEVYVRGLLFRGNPGGPGMMVSGADSRLYVDDTRVVGNNGGGIMVEMGGYLQLRNSIVGGNGGGGTPTSTGVRVVNGDADIIASTVAGNNATVNDSLQCVMNANVTVRNSILVGANAPSVSCPGLVATYSAFDQAVPNNENVGPLDIVWFEAVPTDFTLTPAGFAEFADIARWTTGDPPLDIEGTPRAGADGVMEQAGADVAP